MKVVVAIPFVVMAEDAMLLNIDNRDDDDEDDEEEGQDVITMVDRSRNEGIPSSSRFTTTETRYPYSRQCCGCSSIPISLSST